MIWCRYRHSALWDFGFGENGNNGLYIMINEAF